MDFEGFLFLGSPRTNVFLSVPESSAVGFIFMNWTPRPVKLPTGVGKYDALLHFARRRHDALFRFRKWPKKHQKKFKKKERNQRENEFELDPFSRRLSLRHGLNHQTTRLLTLEDLAPVGWARASRIIRESGLWKIDEWKVFLFFFVLFRASTGTFSATGRNALHLSGCTQAPPDWPNSACKWTNRQQLRSNRCVFL